MNFLKLMHNEKEILKKKIEKPLQILGTSKHWIQDLRILNEEKKGSGFMPAEDGATAHPRPSTIFIQRKGRLIILQVFI